MSHESVLLTFKVHREGMYFVGECLELGTSSFGESEDEAVRAVVDATSLYLESMEELGQLDEILSEAGLTLESDSSLVALMTTPDADHTITRRPVTVS